MIDYKSVDVVTKQLEKAQHNQTDQRELARECDTFVTKVNGQWEPSIWSQWESAKRPRYSFDRTTPIIDLIVGELEQNEFAAEVSPSGGEATKEVAEIIDGMVRSIQNKSNAQSIYKKVARKVVTMGFDAIRVKTQYQDSDSFNQELMIEHIPNAIDRVWFDQGSEMQDASDAEWAIVLQGLTKDQYKEKFPKGSQQSIDTNVQSETYEYKREIITVGQIYYKKYEEREIVQLSTGEVVEAGFYEKNKDQIIALGVEEKKRRKRKITKVCTRFFGPDEWLGDEMLTPFNRLPIIPFYHCFEISEDKVIWRRIVEKLMDPQRIYNYAQSRKIEEGALAPREKTWMTRDQAKGHEASIRTMNTNADPVQFYNAVPNAPAPYKTSPPNVNPALTETAQSAAADIEAISGMYAANLAKNPGNQSGKALGIQIDKGDTGNVSFYADMAIGITALCKCIVGALPVIHDTKETVTLIKPDGQKDYAVINDGQFSNGVKQVMNDLSKGSYDVVCEMGVMFKNRLEKANDAIIQVAQVMPEVLSNNADIFLRNIDAPNSDAMADRARAQLFNQGLIPESQMNEEELAQVQAAQANQQPSAQDVALQAEAEARMMEGQAAIQNEMNDAKKNEIEVAKVMLKDKELNIKAQEVGAKVDNINIDSALKGADLTGKQIDNIKNLNS